MKWSLWNTQWNKREDIYSPSTPYVRYERRDDSDIKGRDVEIWDVEWISANQIALALKNGLIEILQIDEGGETTNNRVIKQFKHEYVSLKISTTLQLRNNFAFLLVKNWITYLKWNEMTKYWASCSSRDELIKV